MINVKKPGLQTAVQDEGRYGHYDVGMSPSGALDKNSYRIANMLAGNEPGAAALESVFVGPTLEFTEEYTIALTGAEMQPKINGEAVAMWSAIRVKAGDVLSFGALKSGCRGYIAVSGGIDVPLVQGSRSTFLSSRIGGLEGRALKAGDVLKVGNMKKCDVADGTKVPEQYIPKYSTHYDLRIMTCMFYYRLSEKGKQALVDATWTITPDANRVGYRIHPDIPLELIEREQPFGAGSGQTNVVEAGYPVGGIQVPDPTEPIALLADTVTCGGYMTPAAIISVDLNMLAQAKTNETIKFKVVDMDEALAARKANNDMLNAIAAHIAAASK